MKNKDKIMYLLFFIAIVMIVYLYFKLENTNENQELLEVKRRVDVLTQNDSLLTLQLKTKILTSDSIIKQLNTRLIDNEKEIKRIRKNIIVFDVDASKLPEF
jgi:hypothetical protein